MESYCMQSFDLLTQHSPWRFIQVVTCIKLFVPFYCQVIFIAERYTCTTVCLYIHLSQDIWSDLRFGSYK